MKNTLTLILAIFFTLSINAQKITLNNEPPEGSLITNASGVQEKLLNSTRRTSIKLSKYYKADDGSLIYVRQIDNKVYALADRYDRKFSSILVGKIKNNILQAKYYFIPKGEANGYGDLRFKIEGRRLVLINSSNRLNANVGDKINFKSMSTISSLPAKIPVDEKARYRGNTQDNLTGRYKADNVGVSYILDLDGQIISYARGARKTNHSRPQFSTIFIGEKNGSRVKGQYVDLPLGYTVGVGNTAFNLIGAHTLRVDKDYFYYGFQHKRAVDDTKEIVK